MTIRVEPARLDWLTALAESDDAFAERFGAPVEPGWIDFPEALPVAVAAVDAARNAAVEVVIATLWPKSTP